MAPSTSRFPRAAATLLAVLALVASLLMPPAASAAPEPPIEDVDIDHGLPDLDERPRVELGDDERARIAGVLADRLGVDPENLEVGWSPFGTPASLGTRDATPLLRSDGAEDPVEAARGLLELIGDLLGLDEAALAGLDASQPNDAQKGSVRVRFTQRLSGLPVFATGWLVVLDNDSNVFFAGGDLAPVGDAGPPPTPAVDPAQAAAAAAAAVAPGGKAEPPECRQGGDPGPSIAAVSPRLGYECTNTAALPDVENPAPIVVTPAYLPVGDAIVPAWQVLVPVGSNAEYLMLVDAVTGEILVRQNQWSSDDVGRVFTGPDPGDSPWTGADATQSDVQFPSSWNTGATPAGQYATAFQDLFDDETPDAGDRPDADGNGDFLFTWTDPWGNAPNTIPSAGADRDAVVTQLYYYTSWFAEYVYGLGFDENANHFALDNNGDGDSDDAGEGDAVSAETDDSYGDGTTELCQDSDSNPIPCRNNANFNANGPDGTVPRMQMYVGEQDLGGGAFRRTQRAMNRDTVIHEFMHGVSGRIMSNGNLQGGVQSGALGEGMGDAMATSVNDDPVYGEYNNGNETTGIRGVAYDDDNLEYGDLCNNGAPNPCQVHDDGRIWAMAMWEQRTALQAKLGDGPGQALHERLMIQGMLNTPDTPSFHDARSGYLLADVLDPSADNQCLLWRVFADNELGVTMSPDGDNDSTPTVSTATPASCDPGASIADPAQTPEGTFVTLDASGSSVGGDPGDVLTFAWDLNDDGVFTDAFGDTVDLAFGDNGSYPVAVEVINTAGYTDSASATVTVTNAVPVVTVSNLDPNPSDEGDDVDVTATFTDPGWLDTHGNGNVDLGTSDLADEPALVTNDPTSSAMYVLSPGVAPQASGEASATVTYGDNGTYQVTVSVTDDDGDTGSGSDDQSVDNVDPTVAIDLGATQVYDSQPPVFIVEKGDDLTVPANAVDPGSDDLTFTWDWDDGSTDSQTSLVNDPAFDPGFPPGSPTIQPRDVTLDATHAYAEACLYELEVSVDDDDGGTHADTVAVIITGNADVSKGHGWWLNQYRPKPPNSFTEAELECYLQIVGYLSLVFDEQKDASTRELATLVLNNPAKAPADVIFDQHALGAWLNFANGSVKLDTPVDTDKDGVADSTFGDVMLTAELVRVNPASTSAEIKAQKNIVERIATQSAP